MCSDGSDVALGRGVIIRLKSQAKPIHHFHGVLLGNVAVHLVEARRGSPATEGEQRVPRHSSLGHQGRPRVPQGMWVHDGNSSSLTGPAKRLPKALSGDVRVGRRRENPARLRTSNLEPPPLERARQVLGKGDGTRRARLRLESDVVLWPDDQHAVKATIEVHVAPFSREHFTASHAQDDAGRNGEEA